MTESDREEEEQRGPTIRDKRRIDPETFQVRDPQATAAPLPGEDPAESEAPVDLETSEPVQADAGEVEASEVTELKAALAERTSDLQRLQAEYVNYKRRVDRDRDVARLVTIEGVLKDFLPVLDDVRSAREHDELTGGFKAVAEEVERVAGKYGLESYGTEGDAFDPHIHEALMHAHADNIEGPTCVAILQPGYRVKDKVLRPARVAVAEPAEESVQTQPAQDQQTEAAPSPEGESSIS